MWKETIEVNGPYHFKQVISRLSLDPLNHVNDKERIVNVPLLMNRKRNVIGVKAVGTTELPKFELSGHDENVKEQAIAEIRRIFQWDFSMKTVVKHFENTNLAEIFKEHRGTPLVLEFDLYRCLMKCIIHQQLNVTFAHTLTERFVKEFGKAVDGVWFYPEPEVVANISVDQLRNLQFSQRKAEYIIDTSRLISEGQLDLSKLYQLSNEEIIEKLVKIRGIGPWTAQNLLLSGLGRKNLFPKADIGIQKAIQKHFNLDKKPTSEEMDYYSQSWSPYLSYATLYLWRSIE
ncbi:DNA-3-methyladenine glycosylase family protein [Metabacillus malikii]|nr:DNA-3-methyladenine glycosylase [Metabacillus malikii]